MKKSTSFKSYKPTIEILETRLAPAVRIVDTVQDTVDGGAAGELRSEIAAAATGDTIRIAIPAIQNPVITLLRGEILTDLNLTIEAVSPGTVTIDGNGARIFDFEKATGPVTETIIGLTFINGRVNQDWGGAIYIEGNLTLQFCQFENNRATFGGGAVAVTGVGTNTTVNVTASNFFNNQGGLQGGAISILPRDPEAIRTPISTVIESSIFVNNRAARGGAVDDGGNGLHNLTISNSTFGWNVAQGTAGGAVYSQDGELQVSRSRFDSNGALNWGGAVYWEPETSNPRTFSAQFLESDFTDNGAKSAGGGLFMSGGDSATINGCLFYNNGSAGKTEADYGGGGLAAINQASLTVSNTTFYHNLSLYFGGGLTINSTGAGTTVSLISLTILDNVAIRQGGGVNTYRENGAPTPMIWNCIVASNAADTGANVYGAVNSQGFNLVGNVAGSSGWDTNPGSPEPDQVGVLAVGLSALASNGGPTVRWQFLQPVPPIERATLHFKANPLRSTKINGAEHASVQLVGTRKSQSGRLILMEAPVLTMLLPAPITRLLPSKTPHTPSRQLISVFPTPMTRPPTSFSR